MLISTIARIAERGGEIVIRNPGPVTGIYITTHGKLSNETVVQKAVSLATSGTQTVYELSHKISDLEESCVIYF